MNNYPVGGGTIGVANQVMAGSAPEASSGESMVSPELAAAMMKKFKSKPKPTSGSQSGLGTASQSSVGPAPGGLTAGPEPRLMASHLRSLTDGFTK